MPETTDDRLDLPTRSAEPWQAPYVAYAGLLLVCVVAVVVTRHPLVFTGAVVAFAALLRARR